MISPRLAEELKQCAKLLQICETKNQKDALSLVRMVIKDLRCIRSQLIVRKVKRSPSLPNDSLPDSISHHQGKDKC